jgi:ankyrin repeat protein
MHSAERPYPLHFAAAYRSFEVMKRLYNLYPEAVKIGAPDCLNTPFYSAVSHSDDVEKIRFLYQAYPEAARIKGPPDHADSLPLHAAVNMMNLEVVTLVYDRHPDAVKFPDTNGQFPLERALLHDNASWAVSECGEHVDIFRFLLKKYPHAALAGDDRLLDRMVRLVEIMPAANYYIRAMVRAVRDVVDSAADVPEKHLDLFYELNYAARRAAIFLLFGQDIVPMSVPTASASIPSHALAIYSDEEQAQSSQDRANDVVVAVWCRLRESGSRELQQAVLSFL